jgi:adenine-specific DNA-methyltransferase
MADLISEGKVLFPRSDEGRPREKKFRKEMRAEFIAFRSIIDGIHTADGTQEIRSLFGVDLFAFPKPTELIANLIEQVAADGDIVLDFFAGSGTTGHAVLKQNAAENVTRRYILVQLPEPLDPNNREQKVAADFCDKLALPRTISELTKERLGVLPSGSMRRTPYSRAILVFALTSWPRQTFAPGSPTPPT